MSQVQQTIRVRFISFYFGNQNLADLQCKLGNWDCLVVQYKLNKLILFISNVYYKVKSCLPGCQLTNWAIWLLYNQLLS